MDADPAYARQIMAKLQEWKEDYDRWDNTVAVSYGYNVAEHQAEKSLIPRKKRWSSLRLNRRNLQAQENLRIFQSQLAKRDFFL